MIKSELRVPSLTHAKAAGICETALKAMGLDAKKALDYRDGYDFLVGGQVRLAVRYAFPTSDREQVYTKRNGEVSRYVYKRWTFNFHRHGKMDVRYCDFFICLLAPVGDDTAVRGDLSVFVIPWEAVTGLTFCSSTRAGSTRQYRGKYARFRDGWNLISQAAGVGLAQTGRIKINEKARAALRLVKGGADSRATAKGGNKLIKLRGEGDVDGDGSDQPPVGPTGRGLRPVV